MGYRFVGVYGQKRQPDSIYYADRLQGDEVDRIIG